MSASSRSAYRKWNVMTVCKTLKTDKMSHISDIDWTITDSAFSNRKFNRKKVDMLFNDT